MTKKDFLNALVDPAHADIKVKLRTLRKELRAIDWKLKYYYHKRRRTFYIVMTPNTVEAKDHTTHAVRQFLLVNNAYSNSDHAVDRYYNIHADIYIAQ